MCLKRNYLKAVKGKIIIPAAVAVGLICTAAPEALAYNVKKGDTLSGISKNQGVSLQTLLKNNPQIENPDLIFVGDEIKTSGDDVAASDVPAATNASVSAYERDLLARLIEAEANGEPYAGKVAVGQVVLNRVQSSEFPDTITGVITQSGQFSPVASGAINKIASVESVRAADDAISQGAGRLSGSLYFYNPNAVSSPYMESLQTVTVIGNHVFKK